MPLVETTIFDYFCRDTPGDLSNIESICKNWKKEGRLFATHSIKIFTWNNKLFVSNFTNRNVTSIFTSLARKVDLFFRSSENEFENFVLHGFPTYKWKVEGTLIESRNSGLDDQCKVGNGYLARSAKEKKNQVCTNKL